MAGEILGKEGGEKLEKKLEEKFEEKLEKSKRWELRNWSEFHFYIEEEGAEKARSDP